MKLLTALTALLSTALAASRTSPPAGCLTVSKSGGGGQYTTIQAAVNALSTTSTAAQCVFIYPGVYTEQVLVPARQAQLSVYGSTADTSSYAANRVTITGSKSQADGLTNDETATLRVKAAGFRLYNVNVANTYGKGSQAVAVSAQAESGYYGCALTGYQDTLLANTGAQVYSKCLIQGATDFIFGRDAPAWFEKCDIRVVAASLGYITASGRQSSSSPGYYVFNNCNVAAASGNTVPKGAYYLGRPWAEYARVVFQKTSMSEVINSAGWRIWNSGDERTGHVLFGEYGNTGTGAAGTRASFSTKLSSAVTMSSVLGSNYQSAKYFDASYLP
ncbi:carbohydrate esterase family 8 protein [Canariomyces notabilis]|uniref:Pectinesterase n=1 Tax=Canariomyces notabilis TaxID=2074819 RepID=A0AAN6QBH9_9PEZI|nr:carbohydrate esterase family 8 protein [Canariomyces arenarius]